MPITNKFSTRSITAGLASCRQAAAAAAEDAPHRLHAQARRYAPPRAVLPIARADWRRFRIGPASAAAASARGMLGAALLFRADGVSQRVRGCAQRGKF